MNSATILCVFLQSRSEVSTISFSRVYTSKICNDRSHRTSKTAVISSTAHGNLNYGN